MEFKYHSRLDNCIKSVELSDSEAREFKSRYEQYKRVLHDAGILTFEDYVCAVLALHG